MSQYTPFGHTSVSQLSLSFKDFRLKNCIYIFHLYHHEPAVATRLRRAGFASGQHVEFVVDKAELGQVSSEYFDFPGQHVGFVVDKRNWGRFPPNTSISPANHHSTNFSIIIIIGGWHNRPIGGRSAEWT
jgi:hypothetical protein